MKRPVGISPRAVALGGPGDAGALQPSVSPHAFPRRARPSDLNGFAPPRILRVPVVILLLLVLTSLSRGADPATQPAYDWQKWRQFWSFKEISHPARPPVKDSAWVRNPIDSFVLAHLEEKRI